MTRFDQVVMDWGDGREVVLTVTVNSRGYTGQEQDWQLAQRVAAGIWAGWRIAELETAAATRDNADPD